MHVHLTPQEISALQDAISASMKLGPLRDGIEEKLSAAAEEVKLPDAAAAAFGAPRKPGIHEMMSLLVSTVASLAGSHVRGIKISYMGEYSGPERDPDCDDEPWRVLIGMVRVARDRRSKNWGHPAIGYSRNPMVACAEALRDLEMYLALPDESLAYPADNSARQPCGEDLIRDYGDAVVRSWWLQNIAVLSDDQLGRITPPVGMQPMLAISVGVYIRAEIRSVRSTMQGLGLEWVGDTTMLRVLQYAVKNGSSCVKVFDDPLPALDAYKLSRGDPDGDDFYKDDE